MEPIELLKRSDLFCGLTDEDLRQVAAIGHQKTYNAGDVIIREGEPSEELYVVQKGMVEVVVPYGAIADIPGSPELTPVVQLGEGQIFGEMGLVDRGSRSATIRALTDGTVVFVLPREALYDLCEQNHSIGYVVMRNIARDLSFKLRHRNLLLEAGW